MQFLQFNRDILAAVYDLIYKTILVFKHTFYWTIKKIYDILVQPPKPYIVFPYLFNE